MTTPARISVLGDPGNPDAPRGTRPWSVSMRIELLSVLHQRDDADNHLQRLRDLFVEHDGWRALTDARGKLFASWEAFCLAPQPYGLGVNAADLDAEVTRREVRRRGGDRKSARSKEESNLYYKVDSYGTSKAYRLAQLDRDRPDLAARVRAGKLSAHAAGIQAGLIKPQTPFDQIKRLVLNKLGPADRALLRRWLETL